MTVKKLFVRLFKKKCHDRFRLVLGRFIGSLSVPRSLRDSYLEKSRKDQLLSSKNRSSLPTS